MLRDHQSALPSPQMKTPGMRPGVFTVAPNTHVTAFSRSMMSSAAANNASAVPATIRMNAIFELLRDVTGEMVLFHRAGAKSLMNV
jgi:hypothetical protein